MFLYFLFFSKKIDEFSKASGNKLWGSTILGMALYDSQQDDVDMDAIITRVYPGSGSFSTAAAECAQLPRMPNGS